MKKLHIAVTGINASDNPAPGIGVARSLKESSLNIKIAGLAYDAMEPGIYMNWLIDKSFLIPYPNTNADALLERILHIKNSFGMDIIIPTLDSELPFFIKYKTILNKHGIKTYLPTQEQFDIRNKVKLFELAMATGIKAPKQRVVNSYTEISHALRKIKLPVMVKGPLYKAYRANTFEETTAYFTKLSTDWGYPIIIQEIIHGDEMNVIGIGDGKGKTPGLVAIKKMSITELGKIWTGITITHDRLLAVTTEFVENTQWQGAFEMEYIVNRDDVYLIEINPRFPAWVYFATGVGVNLPEILVKLLCQQELPNDCSYEAGKLYIRYTGEQICDMSTLQNIATNGES